MRVHVLGTIAVCPDGGEPVPVTSTRQRRLLARLSVTANELVSEDALQAAVWPAGPPESARTALQTHVSALRDRMEPDRARRSSGSFLLTRPGGYVLRVRPAQLDALEFQSAVEDALNAPGHAQTYRAMRVALRSWQEQPFAELGSEE